MDTRARVIVTVGLVMVLAGIALYVAVPSMAAPLAGLILAAAGAVIVVAALPRSGSGRG